MTGWQDGSKDRGYVAARPHVLVPIPVTYLETDPLPHTLSQYRVVLTPHLCCRLM